MRKNGLCDDLIRFHKTSWIVCCSPSSVSRSVFLSLNTLSQNNMIYFMIFITLAPACMPLQFNMNMLVLKHMFKSYELSMTTVISLIRIGVVCMQIIIRALRFCFSTGFYLLRNQLIFELPQITLQISNCLAHPSPFSFFVEQLST